MSGKMADSMRGGKERLGGVGREVRSAGGEGLGRREMGVREKVDGK